MPSYQPPLRDYHFILHEALKVHEETAIEGYGELTEDFTGAVLEEAGKIASEVLAPINLSGDVQGCTLENGVVNAEYGDVGQATASIETSANSVAVVSAFTMVDIDSARIEVPLERARPATGAFDPHGLVSGQLLGATGGKIHRVRSSRSITLEDWYEEVFFGRRVSGDVPFKVDPAMTGGTTFVVGVPQPVGHLAAAEGAAGPGVFTLERIGLASQLEPAAGGTIAQDLSLDLVADTDGIFHVYLTGDTRAGRIIELPGSSHRFHYLTAHVFLGQHHDDVYLAFNTETKKGFCRVDAFTACLVEHRASGSAGLAGGFQDILGAFVLDHDDYQFKMHVDTSI